LALTTHSSAPESTRAAGAPGSTLSRWFDVGPAADPPAQPPAEDGAMAYDPRHHRPIMFGGKGDDDHDVNELWSLDVVTRQWQKIEPRGDWPPASEDHTLIYDPVGYRMIMYGGENGSPTNKTWSLDLTTLGWRDLTDPSAPFREDHTAIYDSRAKRMVVFGGRDTFINTPDEVWTFDLDLSSPNLYHWERLATTGPTPGGRSDHTAIYDSTGNRMIIFGGWDRVTREYLGDTWAFHFPDLPGDPGRWEHIFTKKSHPPKRRHVVGVYDPSRNWLIIMGGRGEEGFMNDAWALDLDANPLVWINITPGPEPRLDHQAVYDAETHRMLIFGGDAHQKVKFRDLWELDVDPGLPLQELIKGAGVKQTEHAKGLVDQ